MRNKILLLFLVLVYSSIYGQTGSVSGTVSSAVTGEPLEGVNVFIETLNFGSSTNNKGEYKIEGIKSGTYKFVYSHLGYASEKMEFTVLPGSNITIDLSLEKSLVRLGEVKIESAKIEKTEREIPLPVEIVKPEQIIVKPYANVSEAVMNEPGIDISRDGIWASQVTIRGLGKENVVTLVDGNRIETATNVAAGLSLVDVYDIESIEIIKGGVSSLYGSGATGGIVNVITQSGRYSDSFTVSGSVLSGYNSVNEGAFGSLGLNAGAENWYLNLRGTLRNARDSETPVGILKNSQYRDRNISVNAGARLFDNQEVKVSYQNFYGEDIGIPGGDPFPAGAVAVYPEVSREMYSGEYIVYSPFKNLSRASVKYFHQLIKREAELRPNANAIVNPKADHTADGAQLNTSWLFGENNIVAAGVDFWQRKYEGERMRTIIPKKQVIYDTPVPESTYRSFGVFAKDNISVSEKLKLDIGGRYDFINITNEALKNPGYTVINGQRRELPGDPMASYEEGDENNYSWSANAGMIYSLTRNMDVTFNAARAFRSPNLEERFQYIDLNGNIYLGNPELEPEKSYTFDAGFRVWKNNFTFKGDFFLNMIDDLVIDGIVIPDSLYRKQNVGEARLYGFDFGFEYNFYKGLVLFGNGAYIRGEDTGNEKDLPGISPLNGLAGLRGDVYRLFEYNVNALIFSDQENLAPGESRTPGYAVFNLALSSKKLETGIVGVQVFAGVENIFDKAYKNHLSTYRGVQLYEPGRNFYAKLRVMF